MESYNPTKPTYIVRYRGSDFLVGEDGYDFTTEREAHEWAEKRSQDTWREPNNGDYTVHLVTPEVGPAISKPVPVAPWVHQGRYVWGYGYDGSTEYLVTHVNEDGSVSLAWSAGPNKPALALENAEGVERYTRIG